ncbi:related to transcription factor, SIN3 binding [Cephalotrichum gorgonifer]|uniref:Related to transcription factor, SIN3 binding n=1 Tax=Cephalotrichum gorgonifer TaxID=2041049 RepID=A0AAE8SVA3_9PEZI|nr:related to transcription factor, SIN3 binding [Cephalotrichum gorgonifer]
MADPAADRAAGRGLRRVPQQLRKRSAQSCDLCRKRRCKCVPGQSGRACATCEKHNVDCSYTLPRKPRFYGSIDDLSDRHKCLEAIVKGAFPGEPTETVADLRKIGQRMGYSMPPPRPQQQQQSSLSALVKSYVVDPGPPPPPPQLRLLCPDVGITASGRLSGYVAGDDSPPDDGESLGLIQDPSGRQHYIGPSGSLQFLSQLRRLLIARNRQQPVDDDESPGASKFTEDNVAQALEAESFPVNVEDAAAERTGEGGGAHNELSPSSISSSIARDFTRQPWDAASDLFKKLPPRQVTDQLLQSYFKSAHEDFPLFHRGTFEEEYESYWARNKQHISGPESVQTPQVEWGWFAVLQMMIVFGSMCDPSIPGIDHAPLRSKCVVITRGLLPQLVCKCSLSNVRALLLLSLFLHNNNERNAAWNLVGAATRISFALGLHRRDVAACFRPIEREVRKRVFCTLYEFEQFLASSLGRPSGLNDSDVETALPKEGVLGTAGMGRVVALSVKLQRILGRARTSHAVRSLSNRDASAPGHEASAKETMALLKEWHEELASCQSLNIPSIVEPDDSFKEVSPPTTMSFNEVKFLLGWQDRTRLRAALVLHMQYRYIAIMVSRPFLLRDAALARVSQLEANEPGVGASPALADICVQNACQLAKIVLLLGEFDLVSGVCGMDVFYAYSASMVLILGSIRESTRGPSASETKVQADLRQLTKSLWQVVSKVPKSGTMTRFTRVMAAFEESVFNHGSAARPELSRSYAPTPRKENGEQCIHPGMEMAPVSRFGSVDPGLVVPQAPTMAGFLGTSFPGMEVWPQADWGTFDDGREFNSWIASLLQPVDTTMAADFELDSVSTDAPM